MTRAFWCAALLGVILPSAAEAGAKKPHIILILADDLGPGDLGCYGSKIAATPHLDRLAKEGTRFTQFCMTGVTCCPST